jgi:membrane fusion protein, multidrug efflux system
MKKYLIYGILASMVLSSCGGSKKDDASILNDQKVQLEKLRKDKDALDEKIKATEAVINKLDPTAAAAQKTKLVTIQSIQSGEFAHYIELEGKVDAENVSYITPRGGPGQIKAIYVKQGEFVKKGQLLLKLDDAIVNQNLTAARQGLETIKTQLAFAKNIYQRQKNLWDQNIGTEVQLITAKNNVATLENQLQSAQENVKVVQEQLKTTSVCSDVNGVADMVTVKQGEFFGTQGSGVIKIVNTSLLKITGNIPENYLSTIHKGIPIIVNLPDGNRTLHTAVSFVGASIDPINRGFVVEAKLPSDPSLKPNQVAMLQIKDYTVANAISVPLNTIQNDERGKFVMVASKENNKLIARKRSVIIGMLSDNEIEIKSGLKVGEQLITEGFGSLYEGQLLTLSSQ